MRKGIGYVAQDPVLFNISVKENILFGAPNATDSKVR
jgi:ABC-type multidrug transport system fused ATPase/permease subunit